MSRVGDIIARARDTLSDSDETRHDTARLLRALSEGQSKIAKHSLSIRYKCTVELCHLHHTYKIDSSAVEANGGTPIAIYGVRNHAGKPCRFVTEDYMDRKYPNWVTAVGADITHIVYNKQQPRLFRVYPTPDSAELDTGATLNTVDNPITDSATLVQPIGVASNFDITKELTPIKLLVDFYLNPPAITTLLDDNLLVPDHYDEALKHYLCAIVLRDDKDSQNRAFGSEEYKFFESAYKVANAMTERDYTEQHESYTAVNYNAELK